MLLINTPMERHMTQYWQALDKFGHASYHLFLTEHFWLASLVEPQHAETSSS